ncbi:hypothetical protein AAE478_007606 [Parahypoxylon ruwenzoriense]
MITAQLSSINSAIYVASRSLVALAANGRSPAFFTQTTARGGVPVNVVVFSNALGLVALLNVAATPGKVFTYLISISGAATFIAWACVGITHLRLRRAWALQDRSVDELPYRALLYPHGAWLVVALNVFLVFISGYEVFVGGFAAVDFVFSYVVLAIFAVLYLGGKVVKKTKIVALEDVDLVTGRRDYLVGVGEEGGSASSSTREKRKVLWYVVIKRFVFS